MDKGQMLPVLTLPAWWVAEQLEVNGIKPTTENINKFLVTMRSKVDETDLVIDVIEEMREET